MVFSAKRKPVEEYRVVYYDGSNLREVIEFIYGFTNFQYDPIANEAKIEVGNYMWPLEKEVYILFDYGLIEILKPSVFKKSFFNSNEYKFKLEKKDE